MALTADVSNKVVTIKTTEGGVFLTQSFDPREEGFKAFASNADAQEWADAFILQTESEEAEKAIEEAEKRAAFEADEAAISAAAEETTEDVEEPSAE